MPNYFDYMLESAETQIETFDDVDFLYNEMDASMCEFDSYVQEGVGVKILIGIGIAAALGGLIALIVKLFSKKNGKSAAAKASQTKDLLNIARQNGVTSLTVNLPKGMDIDPAADNTIQLVNHYSKYVGKYVDLFKAKVESMEGRQVSNEEMIEALQDIGMTAIQDFPELLQIVQTGKAMADNTEILSKEQIRDKVKEGVHTIAEKHPVEDALAIANKFMEVAKNLLRDGKEVDKERGLLNKFLTKTGIKGKVQDKTFEAITAKVTQAIQSAYDTIDDNCDKIFDAGMKALQKAAPETYEKLKTGGKLSAFFNPVKNDISKSKNGNSATIEGESYSLESDRFFGYILSD